MFLQPLPVCCLPRLLPLEFSAVLILNVLGAMFQTGQGRQSYGDRSRTVYFSGGRQIFGQFELRSVQRFSPLCVFVGVF